MVGIPGEGYGIMARARIPALGETQAVERCKTHEMGGWGRFPTGECHEYRPESRAGLVTLLGNGGEPSTIGRGLGRSYGDAAINPGGGVLNLTRFNRLLAFDAETGVLECEGGVSFSDLLETFVPRGWFLPVTPGTRHITVGGAIANDVHGKNHHCDGAFGAHVRSFVLLTPDGTEHVCSRDENAELFHATLGGIGLTGVIVRARFQMMPISTARMLRQRVQTAALDGTLEELARAERRHQYAVAWLDCLARGGRMGRGVVLKADHAIPGDLPEKIDEPLAMPRRAEKPVPFNMPGAALNTFTVAAFNEAYYRLNPTQDAKLVPLQSFFYPLDSLSQWNRLYGKRGFAQYQATIPLDAPDGLRALLEHLASARRASFLAVLKTFGEAGDGMLSYPSPGFTLALDLPNSRGLVEFLQGLDKVVLAHGGRTYLAKDSCMTVETFRAGYPRWEEFKAVKERVDPHNRLQSAMSRRLGLT